MKPVPKISIFFGIVVSIFYDDYNPPHFRVKYGEFTAQISINDLTVIEGKFPPRALGLVVEWASAHQTELK